MYGDINGGQRRRHVVGSTDFYKHVPREMTEVRHFCWLLLPLYSWSSCIFSYMLNFMQTTWQATKIGVIMSILSIFLMILLFFCETMAFARTKIVHSIEIDSNAEETIALNFNITLYDLHCDFVSVGKSLRFILYI